MLEPTSVSQTSITPVAPTGAYAFAKPAHTQTSINARTSFDANVDYFTEGGRGVGAQISRLPKFVAKVVIGEKPQVNGAAHANFKWSEGAVGNALITAQTILAEAGAVIGAIAGVLTATGKTVIGQSTAGTVAAHAAAGKNMASLAAHVVTSPASVALNWTRFAVAEAVKILPAVGAVLGGTAGTAIGSITGVLAGLSAVLNIGVATSTDPVNGTASTTITTPAPVTATAGT